MVVTNVAPLLQFLVNRSTLGDVAKQADFPQLLAQELSVWVAQQFSHERIGVDYRPCVRFENQDTVLGGLKKTPITNLGILCSRFGLTA